MKNLKIHIVGGTGQMGSWLKEFLQSLGFLVTVSGRTIKPGKNLSLADIVFISIPISAAPTIIKNIAPKVKKDCLLIDLSSTQKQTAEALGETGLAAACLHPLFGPVVTSLQNQKFALFKIKDGPKLDKVTKILKDAGGQIIEMAPEEHDYQMAHIQALTHFINLALAKVLLKNHIDLAGKVSTPVYLAQLSTLNRVISQNAKLLTEIELSNSQFPKIIDQLLNHQTKIKQLIINKNTEGLQQEFLKIQSKMESLSQTTPAIKFVPTKTGLKLSKKETKMAYLGPEGTFSHQAMLTLIKNRPYQPIPCQTLYQIFESVAKGLADFGVVPAENSTEGSIREVLDYLFDFDLRTNMGFEIPIHQNLLSKEKNLSRIKIVLSHPQAIGQCRGWLKKFLPAVKIETTSSTMAAVLDGKLSEVGFIGSKLAAKIHNLNILAKNIEDNHQNITKFYVISKNLTPLNPRSNITLIFLTVFNRVGILRDILNVFADLNINLTRIESRPSREKKWDYHFFVEVETPIDDIRLTQALNILKQYCPTIKILGGI